jgi:hypothetical protein
MSAPTYRWSLTFSRSKVWRKKIDGFKLRYIPRKDNLETYQLSKLASSRTPAPNETFRDMILCPSTQVNDSDVIDDLTD